MIKNSDKIKFYHVTPKKEDDIEFIKDGEEINTKDEIKEKIKEINENLYQKNVTKDDIFYLLEIPMIFY